MDRSQRLVCGSQNGLSTSRRTASLAQTFLIEITMQTGLYRHFKGKFYRVLGLVKHSETEEELVLYHPVGSDQLWVRPRAMWDESINRSEYQGPRFVRVEEDQQPGKQ